MRIFYQLQIICLFMIAGLFSCSSPGDNAKKPVAVPVDTIPAIQLPFKIRCDKFPGIIDPSLYLTPPAETLPGKIPTYYGKIVRGNLTILIQNKKDIQSPILYTINKTGQVIDTLILLDRECYIGVDSHYLPWIEIDNELTVTRTDTSFYSRYVEADDPKTKEVYELAMRTDTTITIAEFKIDDTGKIMEQNQLRNN